MHPLIPEQHLPQNQQNLSLEHPLTHGLHFTGKGAALPGVAIFQGDGPLHPSSTAPNELAGPPPLLGNLDQMPNLSGFARPLDDELRAASRRSQSHSRSSSCFSSRSLSSSSSGTRSSRSGSSSSGSDSRKRKGKGRRRSKPNHHHHHRRSSSSVAPIGGGQMFNQNPNVQSMMITPSGMPPSALPGPMSGLEGLHPGVAAGRGNFQPTGPHLYGYPPTFPGQQAPPIPGLPHPQFGGMLPSIPGLSDPGFGGPAMFPGPRGTIRPGFHTTGQARFMVEGSAPHLADESLQTYPNAAAAPNRLPAHKPVRLTQPKHPLAPPGTPVSS